MKTEPNPHSWGFRTFYLCHLYVLLKALARILVTSFGKNKVNSRNSSLERITISQTHLYFTDIIHAVEREDIN